MFNMRPRKRKLKKGDYVSKDVDVSDEISEELTTQITGADEIVEVKRTEITVPELDASYIGAYRNNPTKLLVATVERGDVYRVFLPEYQVYITTTPAHFALYERTA
jgi:hypothetical protein